MSMAKALDSTRLQQILIVVFVLVVFGLAFQMLGKAYRDTGYDFTSYLLSAKALLDGQDPYATGSPFPYVYPLFLAFALIPLTFLPYGVANLVWFGGSLAALLLAMNLWVGMTMTHTKACYGRRLIVPSICLFLLFLNVIQNNLLNGQANFIVLSLLLWCCYLLNQGGQIRAAILLAAAIAIKLTPVVLLLYLLLRARYRALVLSLVFAVGFCYLPYVLAGDRIDSYYSYYLRHVGGFVLPSGAGAAADTSAMYFSLAGFLRSILPTGAVAGHAGLICGIFVLAVLAVIDVTSRRRDGGHDVFALYLISTLLINPISETHHLIMLLPGVATLGLKVVFDDKYRTPWSISWLALFFALFFAAKAISRNPFYFLAILVLLAALAHLALRPHRARSTT